MSGRYMLDTNIISHMVRGHPLVAGRIRLMPVGALCVSVITEAELAYGLGKRPVSPAKQQAIDAFLARTEVLPWNSAAARGYGRLRAGLECSGKTLAALDTLIAAHALAQDAILVTNDAAFAQVPGLALEDWTRP